MQPTLYTQLTPPQIASPRYLILLEWAILLYSVHCTPWAKFYQSLATVASSTNRDSYELADLNPAPSSSSPRVLTSLAQRGRRRSALPLGSIADSQLRAEIGTGWWTDGEKAASSEQHPRGLLSTRLKFWTEALRRRSQRSSHPQVDCESKAAAKMKFSHSIQFNAVPDWSANYIAYSNLKKLYVGRGSSIAFLITQFVFFFE